MKNHFLFFFLSLLTLGCSKEEIDTPIIEQPSPNTLDLISPVEDSKTGHCCLLFEWSQLEAVESYRFVISHTKSFSDTMFTTTTNETFLTIDSFFIPGLQYHWKVEAQNAELSKESTFTVTDYGERYSGNQLLYQEYRTWLTGIGTTEDTTYFTNIQIEEMQIPLEDVGHIRIGGKRYRYIVPTVPNPNKISFFIQQQTPHFHDHGSLYLDKDSIFLTEGMDANGGGYLKTTEGTL